MAREQLSWACEKEDFRGNKRDDLDVNMTFVMYNPIYPSRRGIVSSRRMRTAPTRSSHRVRWGLRRESVIVGVVFFNRVFPEYRHLDV